MQNVILRLLMLYGIMHISTNIAMHNKSKITQNILLDIRYAQENWSDFLEQSMQDRIKNLLHKDAHNYYPQKNNIIQPRSFNKQYINKLLKECDNLIADFYIRQNQDINKSPNLTYWLSCTILGMFITSGCGFGLCLGASMLSHCSCPVATIGFCCFASTCALPPATAQTLKDISRIIDDGNKISTEELQSLDRLKKYIVKLPIASHFYPLRHNSLQNKFIDISFIFKDSQTYGTFN